MLVYGGYIPVDAGFLLLGGGVTRTGVGARDSTAYKNSRGLFFLSKILKKMDVGYNRIDEDIVYPN